MHQYQGCLAGRIICKSDKQSEDVYGLCNNIISHIALLVLVILYALSITSFNLVSFIWHVKNSNFIQCLLSSSLMLADSLMGVYLLIVVTANFVYSGNIIYVSYHWKSSTLCRVLGTLSVLSLQLSNISTLIISLNRLICFVVNPFQRYGFTTVQTVVCVVVCWCLGSVQPVLAAVLSNVSISNSACVLIGDSLLFHFTIAYIISSVSVSIGLLVIYSIVIHSMMKSANFQSSSDRSKKASIRLGAVILTNSMATMTVTVLSVLSLTRVFVLPSVEAVLIFILLPLNGCLNPVINTMTTSEFWPVLLHLSNCAKKTHGMIRFSGEYMHDKVLAPLILKYKTRPEFFRWKSG